VIRRLTTLIVTGLLTLPAPVAAQSPPVQRLRIYALEGQNAVNYSPLHTATAPVVEVRDQNDRPVDGAIVTFKAPASGAGATFSNGQMTETAVSDFRGQAGVKSYTSNDKPGRFVIEVTANYKGAVGRLLVAQTNSTELPPEISKTSHSNKKLWILLGVAAGVGTGLGIYFGTRDNSSPISVSAGSVGFGAPR